MFRCLFGKCRDMEKNKESTQILQNEKFLKENFMITNREYGIKGSYGKIRICLNKQDNKKYIVKIIKNDKKGKKEAKIYNSMDNIYIGKCIGWYEDKKYIYIFSKKYNGGDLYDLIVSRNGKIQEDEVCHLTKQILMGLEYIHNLGIIHRDIKLSNILVDKNTNIKIIDFGCSEYIEDQDNNDIVGSIDFMAPETLSGNYTKKCDIWSLGCIIFICLFGFNPFNPSSKNTNYKIIQNILKGFEPCVRYGYGAWFPENIKVYENVMDFISNLLVLDPVQRFTIEEALYHPWLKS